MNAFLVKAYYVGILVFEKSVNIDELDQCMKPVKEERGKGEFKISFGYW